MIGQVELSAIVISYHGRQHLPDCLGSLIGSLSDIGHEVIVVDNGSTDGSLEFIRENYPEIKVIDNGRNIGFARAVNRGIEASSGKYMYILNQDLKFESDSTRLLLDRLKEEEDIGLVGPSYWSFEGELLPSARAFPTFRHVVYSTLFLDRSFPKHQELASWRMGWFDHRAEMYADQPMGAAMMIPRAVIGRVGRLDESFPLFFNDVDFCKRLAIVGLKRLYYPAAKVYHHVGGSTRKVPYQKIVQSHQSMSRYLWKYSRWYEYPLTCLSSLLLGLGMVTRALARVIGTK